MRRAFLYHRNTNAMDKAGCLANGICFPTSLDVSDHQAQLYSDLCPLMALPDAGWLAGLLLRVLDGLNSTMHARFHRHDDMSLDWRLLNSIAFLSCIVC